MALSAQETELGQRDKQHAHTLTAPRRLPPHDTAADTTYYCDNKKSAFEHKLRTHAQHHDGERQRRQHTAAGQGGYSER